MSPTLSIDTKAIDSTSIDTEAIDTEAIDTEAVYSKPFAREHLDDLLALISRIAAERWPRMTHLHPGDVAWQFPGAAPKENIRLWYEREALVGYAWFQPPDTLCCDVADVCGAAGLVRVQQLDWAASRRANFDPSYPFYISLKSMDEWAEQILNPPLATSASMRYLATSAFDSDPIEIAWLERHGFDRTEHFEPFLTRELVNEPTPAPPAGIRIRHVEAADFAQRVAVHRAAWWPSTGFNMERYLRVRAFTPTFDAELDLVAEAADGAFACCAIGWTDHVAKTVFVEPFGTHPDWRGKGVSRALVLELLRRAYDKGMRNVRIYTAGFNHQAISLYESCGLTWVDRRRTYMKVL